MGSVLTNMLSSIIRIKSSVSFRVVGRVGTGPRIHDLGALVRQPIIVRIPKWKRSCIVEILLPFHSVILMTLLTGETMCRFLQYHLHLIVVGVCRTIMHVLRSFLRWRFAGMQLRSRVRHRVRQELLLLNTLLQIELHVVDVARQRFVLHLRRQGLIEARQFLHRLILASILFLVPHQSRFEALEVVVVRQIPLFLRFRCRAPIHLSILRERVGFRVVASPSTGDLPLQMSDHLVVESLV